MPARPTLAPPRVGAKCNARKRNGGGRCQQPAGFGTDHSGYGHCKWHTGNTPSGIDFAERQMIEHRIQADTYGARRDVGPHEALLEEVQRTAGHVDWLRQKIAHMEENSLVQDTVKDGRKLDAWVAMYQEERKILISVCNTAIRCGVAERQVKLAEEQGKLIAMMLMKFIQSDVLGLTPEQRANAMPLARNLLLELPSATLESQRGRIIDAEAEEVPVR